jgi:hypothetical protein
MSSRAFLVACALAAGVPAIRAAEPAIPVDAARAAFSEAATLCAADGGRLWGVDLCGPMLLVDPATRAAVASQADAQGALRDAGGVFAGVLPADQDVAKAAEWGGVRWIPLYWPLPPESGERATLLMRESFRRVRPALALPAPHAADTSHLDTLDGRYLLQLEWRALAKALEAQNERGARSAAEDALRFRHERRQLYPGAADAETALELDAGLAEYTGVILGNATPGARLSAVQRELAQHAEDADFEPAFARASGPAYGLLLDRFAPGWQRRLGADADLGAVLLDVLRIDRTADSASQLGRRAARYGGDELLKAEIARDARRRSDAKAKAPR